jgi:hypothetical protein
LITPNYSHPFFRHQQTTGKPIRLPLNPFLGLTRAANHCRGMVMAKLVSPLPNWRSQVILVKAPVANLVSQGEAVSAFPLGVLVGIETFVNEDFPAFSPQAPEDLWLFAVPWDIQLSVQIIEIKRQPKMLFENFFDRNRGLSPSVLQAPARRIHSGG